MNELYLGKYQSSVIQLCLQMLTLAKPIALPLLFLRHIILIANVVYIMDLGLQPLEI